MALLIQFTDDTGTTVDITDRFNLTDGWSVQMNAEECSTATSTITAEDPDDTLMMNGLRGFFISEDSAPADQQRIHHFYTYDRTYSRDGVWRTEGAHNVAITLNDINTLLSRQVLRGTDCNRPAETDVERIQWLLGTTEMNFIGDPTTYVDTSGPVAMDAADYRGQMTNNVMQDCMDSSGKNAYCFEYFDSPNYVIAFWYDLGGSTVRRSDLRITNYEPDVDTDAGVGDPGSGTAYTWAGSLSDNLKRDPSRVYSGVFANYDGGAVFRENTATALAFSHRHTITNWPNIKSSAQAIARADRYLADISTEEDVIEATIEVTPEHVNDAREGEAIECKFTHLPGYESDYSWMRILNRTVTFLTPRRYRIQYTLSAQPASVFSCSTSVAATESTGIVADFGSYGPISIPVSAASFNNAMQISFAAYVGPLLGLGGCAPLVVGGSGWTLLTQESDLGSSGWVALGYNYQPTIAAPANMTVSDTCTGGGTPTAFSNTFAFPSSSGTLVQQSPITGSGAAVLPATPTLGNILYCWNLSSISGGDTSQWLVDGGTILVNGESHNFGQWWLTIGIRCVTSSDTTTIRIPAGSHANYGGVSEWAP